MGSSKLLLRLPSFYLGVGSYVTKHDVFDDWMH